MTNTGQRAIDLLIEEAEDLKDDARYTRAASVAERAVDGARRLGDLVRQVRAASLEAQCLRLGGNSAEAFARYLWILDVCHDPKRQAALAEADLSRTFAWAHVDCVACTRSVPEVSAQKLLQLLDQAEAWLRGIGRADWRDGVLYQRAVILDRIGQKAEALVLLEEAIALKRCHPDSPYYGVENYLWRHGDFLRAQGRMEEAETQYLDVIHSRDCGDIARCAALKGLSRCALARKDTTQALGLAQASLNLAETMRDDDQCLALGLMVEVHRRVGDLDAAEQMAQRQLTVARRIQFQERLFYALTDAAELAVKRNDLARLWVYLDEAKPIGAQLDRFCDEGRADMCDRIAREALDHLMEEADDLRTAGQYLAAVTAADQAFAAARRLEALPADIRAQWMAADCLRMFDPKAAIERYTALVALGDDSRYLGALSESELTDYVARARMQRIECARLLGAPAWDVLAQLDEADAWLRLIGRAKWRAGTLLVRALVLRKLGRHEEAVGHLEAAAVLKRRDPESPGFGVASHLFLLGDSLIEGERLGEAEQCYREALECDSDAYTRCAALRGLVRLALSRGECVEALSLAQSAVALGESADRKILVLALKALLDVHRRRNDLEGMGATAKRLVTAHRDSPNLEDLYFALRDAADVSLKQRDPWLAHQYIDEATPIAATLDQVHGGKAFETGLTSRLQRVGRLKYEAEFQMEIRPAIGQVVSEFFVREARDQYVRGHYQYALVAAETAIERARRDGDVGLLARATLAGAECAMRVGHHPTALQRYAWLLSFCNGGACTVPLDAVELAIVATSTHLGWIRCALFSSRLTADKLLNAISDAESRLRAAGREGWRDGFLYSRGVVLWRLGRLEEAAGHLEAAVVMKRRHPESPTYTLAAYLNSLGDLLVQLNRMHEATRHHREVLDSSTADDHSRCMAYRGLALTEVIRGDLEAARRNAQEALAMVETMGGDSLCAVLSVWVAVQRAYGNLRDAGAAVERLLAASQRVSEDWIFEGLRSAAVVALDGGDWVRARECLDQAAAIAKSRNRWELSVGLSALHHTEERLAELRR